MDLATPSTSKKVRRERPPRCYKGVRMRAWGKWVSEIRIPRSTERIWLGSYDAPEKAARAYDAAVYCIHGECGRLNFPAGRRPLLPKGSAVSLSKKDIQAIATDFASSDVSESSLVPSKMTTQVPSGEPASPDLVVSVDMEITYDLGGDSVAPTCATGAAASSPENLQLDDFLMLDTDWIADLY